MVTLRRAWRNLLFLWAGNERFYPASRWDSIYREGYHLDVHDQDARYGALLALLERYDTSGPILDVGCGEGLLAQKFRRLSNSPILGVDYSRPAIELANAKKIPECEFVCTDYRKINLQPQFGIIVLNESLYYVDDALEALNTLAQYLVSTGVLIVSMYDTFPTRCIWRRLGRHFGIMRSVVVEDETHSKSWRIRVLQPMQRDSNRAPPFRKEPVQTAT
jgi:2-polyprenyl-3-methyl-5-hydroxy-6-metoxy-1,4-benzoquinol methylase